MENCAWKRINYMKRLASIINISNYLDSIGLHEISDNILKKCAKEIKLSQQLCMLCGKNEYECNCYNDYEFNKKNKQYCEKCNNTKASCICKCSLCNQSIKYCDCNRCNHCGALETEELNDKMYFEAEHNDDICECKICTECNKYTDDCNCDRCGNCGLLITFELPWKDGEKAKGNEDACECDRCSNCGRLEDDCSCPKCPRCDDTYEYCNCPKCEDCGLLDPTYLNSREQDQINADEMLCTECRRCPQCKELTRDCECGHSSYFSISNEEIRDNMNSYNTNRLNNELGLDLERLRLAVLQHGNANNETKDRLRESVIRQSEAMAIRLQRAMSANDIRSQEEIINVLDRLKQQSDILNSDQPIFVWSSERKKKEQQDEGQNPKDKNEPNKDFLRQLKDTILLKIKSMNINLNDQSKWGNIGAILQDRYVLMDAKDIANEIEILEEKIKTETNPQDTPSTIGSAGMRSTYWGFHGGERVPEMWISLSANEIDTQHYLLWKRFVDSWSQHSKNSDADIAFAVLVNTDKEGNELPNTWVISQVQSDICGKLVKASRDLNSGIPPYLPYGITIEVFKQFVNDPKVQFILYNWEDLLMKKISYLARQNGATTILMRDTGSTLDDIKIHNKKKVDVTYGGLHERHKFQPYNNQDFDLGDTDLLSRVAKKSRIR